MVECLQCGGTTKLKVVTPDKFKEIAGVLYPTFSFQDCKCVFKRNISRFLGSFNTVRKINVKKSPLNKSVFIVNTPDMFISGEYSLILPHLRSFLIKKDTHHSRTESKQINYIHIDVFQLMDINFEKSEKHSRDSIIDTDLLILDLITCPTNRELGKVLNYFWRVRKNLNKPTFFTQNIKIIDESNVPISAEALSCLRDEELKEQVIKLKNIYGVNITISNTEFV